MMERFLRVWRDYMSKKITTEQYDDEMEALKRIKELGI